MLCPIGIAGLADTSIFFTDWAPIWVDPLFKRFHGAVLYTGIWRELKRKVNS